MKAHYEQKERVGYKFSYRAAASEMKTVRTKGRGGCAFAFGVGCGKEEEGKGENEGADSASRLARPCIRNCQEAYLAKRLQNVYLQISKVTLSYLTTEKAKVLRKHCFLVYIYIHTLR